MYKNGTFYQDRLGTNIGKTQKRRFDVFLRLVPGMTELQMRTLLRLHEESMTIADDDWNAQNAGSEMLVHLAASFQQSVNGVDGARVEGLRSDPTDALVRKTSGCFCMQFCSSHSLII